MTLQPDPTSRLTPLPPVPGAPLDPTQIVGRQADAERAWAKLEHGSLRLNEPRRIGKTSFLSLLEHAPAPGWSVVNQTFQGVASTKEMVRKALEDIAKQQTVGRRVGNAAKAFLTSTSAKVSTPDGFSFELAAAFRDDPLAAFERALTNVAGALKEDEHLLLAWDEVPDMVMAIADHEGDGAAVRALSLMRRFRENTGGAARIRWIMTGSVGFHHVLRRLGRDDLLNELDNFSLGPLDAEWTSVLCERLLRGVDLEPSPAVVDELAELSGGLPVLAHLVASEVRDQQIETVSEGEIRSIFEAAVADLDRSHQLTSFLTRLGPYYGKREDAARWILDTVGSGSATVEALRSASPKKFRLRRTSAVGELLEWLVLDHYLVKARPAVTDADPTYSWRYPPLQRIWELRQP